MIKRTFFILSWFLVCFQPAYTQKKFSEKVMIWVLGVRYADNSMKEFFYLKTKDGFFHVSPYFNDDNMPCFSEKPDSIKGNLILAQDAKGIDIIRKKIDKQKYELLNLKTKKKYNYYWKSVEMSLDYYLLPCRNQFHYLTTIISGTESFVPVKVNSKIVKGKPELVFLNQIEAVLE